MKYDKMIAVNKAESEQKIKKAIRAIDDMGARGLPISVTELVRWTGLSRGFFYKNVQVRQKLEEAIKPVSYTHLDVYKRQGFGRTVTL